MNDNDAIGYIPNLSGKISTMNINTLAGGVNSTRVEFYPCIASNFQFTATAAYVNESYFKLTFSFYTKFFAANSVGYSYLGMRINVSKWMSYFYVNSSLITVESYPDVVKNAYFYMNCISISNTESNNLNRFIFNPIYRVFDTTKSPFSNDYEPIEI